MKTRWKCEIETNTTKNVENETRNGIENEKLQNFKF